MRKEKRTFQIILIAAGAIIFVWLSDLIFPGTASVTQEPLEYNLEVSAQIIPFFAVDLANNPVFNLKKDEFTLSVNGKPCDIYFLKKMEIEEEKEVTHPQEEKPVEKTGVQKLAAVTNPPRIKFIIIDAVFNSDSGIHRSKEIAVNLVNNQAVNDRFIILLNTFSGLQYIIGPESEKELLIKKIQNLKIIPEKHLQNLFIEEKNPSSIISSDISNVNFGSGSDKKEKLAEILKYQVDVIRFAKSLTQFKYALQTISNAKIVFLISGGVKKGAFLETILPGKNENKFFKTYLYQFLKEISKAINNGGSVLYTINSQTTDMDDLENKDNIGEGSLAYMAKEGGGKYFSGSDVAGIVSSIEKTTSAYYEATFIPGPEEKDLMKIDIKCKREGVQLFTINQTEKTQPYINMPPVKKKLFAYDVISGGNWSRMVGKVMKAKFKTSKKEKGEIYSIQVPLPGEMKNRKLDVFSISLDTNNQAVTVNALTNEAKEILNIKIPRKKDSKCSFVIIEPTGTWCIYNELE